MWLETRTTVPTGQSSKPQSKPPWDLEFSRGSEVAGGTDFRRIQGDFLLCPVTPQNSLVGVTIVGVASGVGGL